MWIFRDNGHKNIRLCFVHYPLIPVRVSLHIERHTFYFVYISQTCIILCEITIDGNDRKAVFRIYLFICFSHCISINVLYMHLFAKHGFLGSFLILKQFKYLIFIALSDVSLVYSLRYLIKLQTKHHRLIFIGESICVLSPQGYRYNGIGFYFIS